MNAKAGKKPRRTPGGARLPRPSSERPNRGIFTMYFANGGAPKPFTPELETRYSSQLQDLRALLAKGNFAAALEAMLLCRRRDLSRRARDGAAPDSEAVFPLRWASSVDQNEFCEVPIWLFGVALKGVAAWLESIPVGSRGHNARWASRWRQDMIDFDRWSAVGLLHSRGIGFTNRRQGGDLDTIYDKASKYLNGPAAGSASTVRKSYLKVQKILKKEPWRYHVFNEIGDEVGYSTVPRAIEWYGKPVSPP